MNPLFAITPRAGARNLITDVPGIRVGHATDELAGTGVTTLFCSDAVATGVDVRGGAPGVRETDTLAPDSLVGKAHAIVLSGGSVFGLAAADGVAVALSQAGTGLHLVHGTHAIPIVPAAVLHDLGNAGNKAWREPPYRELGVATVAAAGSDFALGAVGAGRGARAGLRSGGIGSASLDLGNGLVVGALVAVNPVGSVYMPDGKTYWAWPYELDGEFGGQRPHDCPAALLPVPADCRIASLGAHTPGTSTVIGIVATSARLSSAGCRRLAMMAQDGIARAVRPAHTPFDGDTLFGVSTGTAVAPAGLTEPGLVAWLGAAAADCMARAIARGVHAAAASAAESPPSNALSAD